MNEPTTSSTFAIRHRRTGEVLFECEPLKGQSLTITAQDCHLIEQAIAAKVDLSEAELCGRSLNGANLSGQNLSGADLTWVNLSQANLSGTVLPAGVPVIPDIDKAILAAIEAGGSLVMEVWHRCDTAHCRAGWAVHLAGRAGYNLEKELGSGTAGALIYAASRPGMPVPDFHTSDRLAMADLIACAGA